MAHAFSSTKMPQQTPIHPGVNTLVDQNEGVEPLSIPTQPAAVSRYGEFSADGREFVFRRFDTPRPWVNYAWNDGYLASIDQRGRGEAICRDEAGNRTVSHRDRLVYLKDRTTREFWTVGWDPVRLPFDRYECRHRLGSTALRCTQGGVRADFEITAHASAPAEIWRITLRNTGAEAREVSLYPAVEFDLGGWVPYGTVENYSICRRVGDRLLLALNQSDERPGARNHAWFAADRTPDHYETRRREFVGGAYGRLEDPASVTGSHLSDADAATEELLGAFQYDIRLAPGEMWSAIFAVGVCGSSDEAETFAAACATAEAFDAGLDAARERTLAFGRLDFELPDPVWTRFFNIWAKQQLFLLKDFTRISLIGFRDTLQDAQALCAYDPGSAGANIIEALEHQHPDGSAMRGWCPDDHHAYADSGVWLAFTLAEHLRETGDMGFLDRAVAFRDGSPGSVWDHQIAAFEWFQANLGAHGLPKLHYGDWNDSLNIGREGRGESVWLAMALVAALKEAAAIADRIGDTGLRVKWSAFADSLSANIETHAWDGEWYLRGFADDGSPVGTHADEEGRIFAEPQSWAVIAGMDSCRWPRVAASVDAHLRTPLGLLVCTPPFTHYQARMGRISCMPPGWGENGSSYCHVTAFQAVAECMKGDGDAALQSLASILPFNPNGPESDSWLEPYAFTNMFRGPHHARPHATFKGWTTGTVPWALRAVTHYLLGIRPEFDGLTIGPCLPSSWPAARVSRRFRDATFHIEFRNPHGLTAGRSLPQLTVNGRLHPGNFLAAGEFSQGTHEVLVEIVPEEEPDSAAG